MDPFESSQFGREGEKAATQRITGQPKDESYAKALGIHEEAGKPGPADYKFNDPWAFENSRNGKLKKLRDTVINRSARQKNQTVPERIQNKNAHKAFVLVCEQGPNRS